MPGDDDWDRAAAEFEEAPTRVDSAPLDARDPAAPQAPIPTPDTTGRYKTLPGFEVSQELLTGERRRGRDEAFTAFRLAMIQSGSHPDAALEQERRLRRWLAENETLVRVTLGRA